MALRKKLAPNGETIIGFVGRFATEKKVNRMSELLSLPNTSFVIVGDGSERSKLENQFAGHKVYFAGRQTGILGLHLELPWLVARLADWFSRCSCGCYVR